MTYWSGLLALVLLMVALAITPILKIFGWGRFIIVRRMIGVTALAYTIAHVIIYFALRFWNFASIVHEMVTRVSLILALISTLGMAALGATSLDAAVQWMGAKGWQRLHNAIYVIAGLAVIHYLLSPDIYPEQFLMSGVFFWLIGWRGLVAAGLARMPAPWHCSPLRRLFSRRLCKSAGFGPTSTMSHQRFSTSISRSTLASRRCGGSLDLGF
jgi:methionine sulfoxide reductase heme-binding subunit